MRRGNYNKTLQLDFAIGTLLDKNQRRQINSRDNCFPTSHCFTLWVIHLDSGLFIPVCTTKLNIIEAMFSHFKQFTRVLFQDNLYSELPKGIENKLSSYRPRIWATWTSDAAKKTLSSMTTETQYATEFPTSTLFRLHWKKMFLPFRDCPRPLSLFQNRRESQDIPKEPTNPHLEPQIPLRSSYLLFIYEIPFLDSIS